MREYGQIQCSFWQSADALTCSDSGKLLAAYLMTGPHSNGIGCYRCPDGYVMADLGWTSETVSKGFEELFRNGFAYRFEGVVCLPKFLFWNRVANANVAKARMAEFVALPKGDSKALAARGLLEFCGFLTADDKRLLETVTQTLSKGYAKQNPTQKGENPEQDPDPEESSLRSESSAPPAADRETPQTESKPKLELVPATDLAEQKAQRLLEVTADAVAAFNSTLGKPNGLLASVQLVNDVRRDQVKRCLPVARAICERLYGAKTITRKFWDDYFAECGRDPFLSGHSKGGKGHENYVPDFELLTRKDKMSAVFDKAMSEDAA